MKKLFVCAMLGCFAMGLGQAQHRLRVDAARQTVQADSIFQTVTEALQFAQQMTTDTLWTDILIAPSVYWLDDADDSAVRTPEPGDREPFALKLRLDRVRLIGQTNDPHDVVLAVNRGQTQGAIGNYTMLHIVGSDIEAQNITFGNYCNVDLDYKRDPRLSRKRRADAIVQAQLAICWGDRYKMSNCRFISRLNLCPFVGPRQVVFDDCYFECTDDALCGTGIYNRCRFTFYSSKPFYCTSAQGAVFNDCDLHSKVQGVQYLTKVSDPVTLNRCRWTSEDPNLRIEWCRKPNPKHRCYMNQCTLNGQPLEVPTTPDLPMPVAMPQMPIWGDTTIIPGRWTLGAYKPLDTAGFNWTVDQTRPAWGYGEGMDGAEGCYGLVQLVRGARLMYTGQDTVAYGGQEVTVQLDPCKSAGQGFGSATGQYMDVCIKFDTRTLTGYGLRIERTPAYDKAVQVQLVCYANGVVERLGQPERCDLYRVGCRLTLRADGKMLNATIACGEAIQTLSAQMAHPNSFGGIHVQHTGSTGPSATVIRGLHVQYF